MNNFLKKFSYVMLIAGILASVVAACVMFSSGYDFLKFPGVIILVLGILLSIYSFGLAIDIVDTNEKQTYQFGTLLEKLNKLENELKEVTYSHHLASLKWGLPTQCS